MSGWTLLRLDAGWTALALAAGLVDLDGCEPTPDLERGLLWAAIIGAEREGKSPDKAREIGLRRAFSARQRRRYDWTVRRIAECWGVSERTVKGDLAAMRKLAGEASVGELLAA